MTLTLDNFDTIFNVLSVATVVLVIVFGPRAVAYARRSRKITRKDTPILLAYYTDGANVIPLAKGMVGELRYAALATTPRTGVNSNQDSAFLMVIDLPFRTKLHLLGVPEKFGNTQINPAGSTSIMEKVHLEGDYPDHFSLYAEQGMQLESRYVLDPAAMAFTIDFCNSYNWEILKDTLYLVSSGAGDPNDSTAMSDDVSRFVEEIRPKVEDKNSPIQERNRLGYGDDYRQDLRCPICSAVMSNQQTHMLCPRGDGVLVSGKNLLELRAGKLHIESVENGVASARQEGSVLTCPSCGGTMDHAAYNGSNLIIDTCPNCPYRWLDAGELIKPVDA